MLTIWDFNKISTIIIKTNNNNNKIIRMMLMNKMNKRKITQINGTNIIQANIIIANHKNTKIFRIILIILILVFPNVIFSSKKRMQHKINTVFNMFKQKLLVINIIV